MNAGGHLTHRPRRLLLWAAGAAGVVALVLAAVAMATGVRLLVVTSGSMAPAIERGSLVIAAPVASADIKTGDVISVTNATGTTVTHRVDSVSLSGDTATLVLKGDANEAADAVPVVVSQAHRVVADVPVAGRAVEIVGSPAVIFAAGVLTALGLLIALGRFAPARSRSAGVALALAVVGPLVLGPGLAQTTVASFNDAATEATGTFSMAAPAGSTCTVVSSSTGLPISGRTCSITSMTYSAWGTTGDRQGLVYVRFSAPGISWTGEQIAFSVNMADATDGGSPISSINWNWSTSATGTVLQSTLTTGYKCSSLPVITGKMDVNLGSSPLFMVWIYEKASSATGKTCS